MPNCTICEKIKNRKTEINDNNFGIAVLTKKLTLYICKECQNEIGNGVKNNVMIKPMILMITKSTGINLLDFFE